MVHIKFIVSMVQMLNSISFVIYIYSSFISQSGNFETDRYDRSSSYYIGFIIKYLIVLITITINYFIQYN